MQIKLKKLTLLLALIIIAVSTASCSKVNNYEVYGSNFEGFLDTNSTISVEYDKRIYSKDEVKEIFTKIRSILINIETNYSIEVTGNMIIEGITNSKVMDINDNAGIEKISVDKQFMDLLKISKEVSDLTNGAYDPTIGSLSNLWDISGKYEKCNPASGAYDPEESKDWCAIPTETEIKENLKIVDYNKILTYEKDSSIMLETEKMKMDLGAIAKGYAADVIMDYLIGYEFSLIVVNLGGNIKTYGQSKNEEYIDIDNIIIGNPFLKDYFDLPKLFEFDTENKTAVTSGKPVRYIVVDGKEYHHILDPKTGYPVSNNIEQVTVITDDSAFADALATGIYIMGIEKGLELVNSLENVDAVYITIDKKIYMSEGLEYKELGKLSDFGFEIM